MSRLKGKTALVTGGARGIGEAICTRLAAEGAHVAVTDIHDHDGRRVADAISTAGGSARYWRMDVTREADVAKTVAAVVAAHGRIDILVNNAGVIGANKPTTELTEADWDVVLAVNVKGVFFCTKSVLPQMIERGAGRIVNLCSVYGTVGAPNAPPYHASKGAVRIMTKTDALLYAKHGIRVNSVSPSFVGTPMLDAFAGSIGDTDRMLEELASMHPVGRIGTPEEVAAAVLYLALDESDFVTGSDLVVDGGYTAR
ncbi:MAG TPA: SDR family oxidoreductase [Gemmatimonadales bacterium]|jgi:NAD(P)-dependent dehydrogenase (short-subunit alcohol dehydrogenase family)